MKISIISNVQFSKTIKKIVRNIAFKEVKMMKIYKKNFFVLTFFLFGLIFSIQVNALNIVFDKNVFSINTNTYIESVLNELEQKIPDKFNQYLQQTIHLKFKNEQPIYNDKHEIVKIHLGKTIHDFSKTEIILNLKFINFSNDEDLKYFSRSKFLKTIVHELSHIYDNLNIEDKQTKEKKQECEILIANYEISQKTSYCHNLTAKNTTISDKPEFLALTHWEDSLFGYEQTNEFKKRLIDPYAVSNRYETFPVLMEGYIFNSDFACRLPAIQKFLDEHFQIKKNHTCLPTLTWYLGNTIDGVQFKSIPVSRIWSVDYMWAANGNEASSSFGHSMIRLVICNANRAPGPDCYKDVDEHLVLSFAAFSPNGQFASWDGLTGKYPLNLFVSTFLSTKINYNLVELRDIYSAPFKLTEEQKNKLIYYLNETMWNYDSRYYFTLRNCSTEIAQSLIASGVPMEIINEFVSNSPSAMFQNFLKSNLSENTYNSLKSIEKNKLLYFPSKRKLLNSALVSISKYLNKTISNFDEYVHYTVNIDLNTWLNKNSIPESILYSFLFLEELNYTKTKVELIKINEPEKFAQARELIAKNQSHAAENNFDYRFGGNLLRNNNFGIPDDGEITEIKKILYLTTAANNKINNEQLSESLAGLSEKYESLKKIKSRLQFIYKKLKK